MSEICQNCKNEDLDEAELPCSQCSQLYDNHWEAK